MLAVYSRVVASWYHLGAMLRIESLIFQIAGRVLFDRANAAIPAGRKVGLVGRNGSGKSTLLRMIAGEIEPDAGEIALRRGVRVATVSQEAPSGPQSLLDTVLAADRERASLLAEADTATDPGRIAEVHDRLADIGAHTATSRAASILAGLGFDSDDQARPVEAFSGGWRMRVALAATLFVEPDLLLLDEPTNYLDLEGTLWLESYLKLYPHTLVVASHDRDLLNVSVDSILHLEGQRLTAYTGGYDAFERLRRERLANLEAQRSKQMAQRRHMHAFIDRFRYKASKARQAQSRLKALERMEPIAAVIGAPDTVFAFPAPKALAPPLISLDGAAVGYADSQPVLRDLSLRIDMDDRIALLGANGNGKSTFAKLLSRRLEPMAGRMTASSKLRVGYFAQHQIDELRPGESAFEHMAALMPKANPVTVRARLGGFGLIQDIANVDVAILSGGEKARLLFALATHAAPQLMVLDEPTNHLDVDARDALIQALNDYPGALILIAHDRHLIEACSDRLWLVSGGTVTPFDGDLDDYRRMLLSERGTPGAGDKGAERVKRPKSSRRDKRRAAANARADRADLRRAAREAEALVGKLAAERSELEAALADPATYAGRKDAVAELTKRQGQIERRLAKAEAAWLKAQGSLEAE